MGNSTSHDTGSQPVCFIVPAEQNKFAQILNDNAPIPESPRRTSTLVDCNELISANRSDFDLTDWARFNLGIYCSRRKSTEWSDKEIWANPDEYAKEKNWLMLPFSSLKNPRHVNLVAHGLTKIFPEIRHLAMHCVTMQLQYNYLEQLPAELGSLDHIRHLNLSQNKLRQLPDEIGCLHNLVELKCSYNKLQELPRTIGNLKNLRVLQVDSNDLQSLPSEIGKCTHLSVIDISHNHNLKWVPAEMGRLKELKRLELSGCLFVVEKISEPPNSSAVPSLKELVARSIVRAKLDCSRMSLPSQLQKYMEKHTSCSFCKGPIFEYIVHRKQPLMRGDMQLPLMHLLCINHWSDESGRIKALFAPPPWTAPAASASKPKQHTASALATSESLPIVNHRTQAPPPPNYAATTNTDNQRFIKHSSTKLKQLLHCQNRGLEEEYLLCIRKNALLIS